MKIWSLGCPGIAPLVGALILSGCANRPPGPTEARSTVASPPSSSAVAAEATIVAVPQPAPTTRSCPPPSDDLGVLEETARAGDPCAEGALADRLLSVRGMPEDYARAFALATRAFDAGVGVRCLSFDLANDRRRLAACFERSGDEGPLALMLAFGDGVPKDLARAKDIAARVGIESCDGTALVEQIALAERVPGPVAPRFCESAACTTLAMNFCAAEGADIESFRTSPERRKSVDALDPTERERYRELVVAFDAYDRTESMRVYQANIDGSLRNIVAMSRTEDLRRQFDGAVAAIVEGTPPRAISAKELASLRKKLAAAERLSETDGIQAIMMPDNQKAFRDASREARKAHARWLAKMLRFAETRFDVTTRASLEGELLQQRLNGLSTVP